MNNYKSLKILVYVMGMVMVLGMIVIAFSIFKLTKPLKINECRSLQLTVPHSILSASMKEDKLILLTTPLKNKQIMKIVDYCSGEVINTIEFNISPSTLQHE